MNFIYNEDQTMFRDGVDRYGLENWPSTGRAALLAQGRDGYPDTWQDMAELGWTLLSIPEDAGGLGGNAVDVMAVAEGIGKHLIAIPYVTNCVLVPTLLAGQSGGKEALASIASGTGIAAAGLDEEDGGGSLSYINTTAVQIDGVWQLNGVKAHVEDGGNATWYVIVARVFGAVDDESGLGLFILPRGTNGLKVEKFRAVDGHIHARVTLTDAAAHPVGAPGEALPIIEHAVDVAISAHLAEALGSIQATNAATLDYLKTRKQFGATIGSFQALQHRMVDMIIAQEEAAAMVWNAVHSCNLPAIDRKAAVSAAKVRVGQCGVYVGQQAIQLHGGVGFSEEHIVSHHMRRQMMLDITHGGQSYHLNRFKTSPA